MCLVELCLQFVVWYGFQCDDGVVTEIVANYSCLRSGGLVCLISTLFSGVVVNTARISDPD